VRPGGDRQYAFEATAPALNVDPELSGNNRPSRDSASTQSEQRANGAAFRFDLLGNVKANGRLACQIRVTEELEGLVVHVPQIQH
jgi:hypothetical protein